MRAQFILNEIGIGLRRNLTMTVAVILTTTVSLALVGAGLLVQRQVSVMKDYWYDRVEVTLYLCAEKSKAANCNGTDISQGEREALNRDLTASPEVETVLYESKDDAFTRFQELFKDSPDLVDNISAGDLPESFRVKLKDPERFEVLASGFRDRPGVDSVQDLKKALEPIFNVLRVFRNGAIFIAIFSLVTSAILIAQTIRVAALSRRRETGIMRLVGASNLYIRLPFLLEGAIAGLLGAGFAIGLLALGKYFLVDQVLRESLPFTNFIAWSDVYSVIPKLLLTSVVLSIPASFFAIRKHLRV